MHSQAGYDDWHRKLCQEIIEYYHQTGIESFSVGQAQKWVNMTMKYLYVHGDVDISSVFNYPHIPVDQYIIAAVKKEFGIFPPDSAWSRINDYDQYLSYEISIREKLAEFGVAPLRWEMGAWQTR